MKIIIVTGMSGAGKTKAADWLEDQGFYCIDNMPPKLVMNFVDLSKANGMDKIAFVADIRGGEFFSDLVEVIDQLKKQEDIESAVFFVDASTPTLVRRFNETRRHHPLAPGKVNQSIIEDERARLESVRKKADYIIDTSTMKVADFNMAMTRIFLGSKGNQFNINVTSFGFKYGIPSESDIMVDVRFIPNPYYIKSLKPLTGNNKKIVNYVFKSELANEFVDRYHALIKELIPGYIHEGKYHLNVAFGCTGGHHRSVAIANKMAELFKADGFRVTVTHRDLDFIAKRDSKK